ncbi:MAG: hypothetical protein R3F37_11120 [Candidatus Competibacteraceae bacterium]
MIAWLRFAFRNLLRNRRRSAYTVLAVGESFAAVNIFGGFTDYIFTNLRDSFIYVQANGLLSVFKTGARQQNNEMESAQALLHREEIDQLRVILRGQENVLAVAEVMTLTGLISNGDTTTIFVGLARVPSERQLFQSHARGLISHLKFFEGRPLQDEIAYGIGIARGLGNKLRLSNGSPAILMAPTVSGQINALDAEVLQITDAPMELLEDKWIAMPLGLAKQLYDYEGAGQVNLLLSRSRDLEQERTYFRLCYAPAVWISKFTPGASCLPSMSRSNACFGYCFYSCS